MGADISVCVGGGGGGRDAREALGRLGLQPPGLAQVRPCPSLMALCLLFLTMVLVVKRMWYVCVLKAEGVTHLCPSGGGGCPSDHVVATRKWYWPHGGLLLLVDDSAGEEPRCAIEWAKAAPGPTHFLVIFVLTFFFWIFFEFFFSCFFFSFLFFFLFSFFFFFLFPFLIFSEFFDLTIRCNPIPGVTPALRKARLQMRPVGQQSPPPPPPPWERGGNSGSWRLFPRHNPSTEFLWRPQSCW